MAALQQGLPVLVDSRGTMRVRLARTRMNLSRWEIYDNSEKSLLLSEIGAVVRNHVMPPLRYTGRSF